MIYLDSSVALSALFTELHSPPLHFWSQHPVSSRLLEYEITNRVYMRIPGAANLDAAQTLLKSVTLLDMTPGILARALKPFPIALRTLDGLHRATMDFLRAQGQTLQLASYDRRFVAAAEALGFSAVAI